MLLEIFLIYHIPPNIRTSKIAHLNKKVWATQLSKVPEITAFAKEHQLSWSIDHLLLIFCSLLVPLIFTQILSESLKLMVYGVTNTLGRANEYKWEIPWTSLAHGRPHSHLLPLSTLGLRYRNRPEYHHYWESLHNCLLKTFVPALLVGLIPLGEVIWSSSVCDEPRWRGSQWLPRF